MDKIFSMFSNPLISYIIERYLREYVDSKKLAKFSSLNTPVLEDIMIANQKADYFNKNFMQEFPFDLHKATISLIKLSVPLSKILSESVVIECKKAFIILKIKQNLTYEQYQLQHDQKKENLKNIKPSDAQKKQGFLDVLVKKIFNKMEIKIDELVVQIFFDEPDSTLPDQFNILLKIKNIQKKYKNLSKNLGSSILGESLMQNSQFDQSIANSQQRQVEQTFSLEINQISLHLMNKGHLNQPEYKNIDQTLEYPWQWPNKAHPSTILIMEHLEATLEVSSNKSMEREEISKQTVLRFNSPLQIQLEPYQLKLIMRCVKQFNNITLTKQRYQYDHSNGESSSPEVRLEGENEQYQNSEIFQDPIDYQDLEQIVTSNHELNEQDLFQSICNFSHKKQQEKKKYSKILLQKADQYVEDHTDTPYTESSRLSIKINKIDIKIFKVSPPKMSREIGLYTEYSRQWKEEWDKKQQDQKKTVQLPVSAYIIRLNRIRTVFKSKNSKMTVLQASVQTLVMYSKDIKEQHLNSSSSIYHSLDAPTENYLSPSFQALFHKNLELVAFKPINSSYHKYIVLYVGASFKSEQVGQHKVTVEGLQTYPDGIRRDEIVQFFQGNRFGTGFSHSRLKNIVYDQSVQQFTQDIVNLPNQEHLSVIRIMQEDQKPRKVTLQAPIILCKFGLDFISDLDKILFPGEFISHFQHILKPIKQIQEPHGQLQQQIEQNIEINIAFVRIIWNTCKLNQNMSEYKKFSNQQLLQMHDVGGQIDEPFGLIFEIDRLKISIPKAIDLEFYNFDIFTYRIIEPELRVIINKLISIAPQLRPKQLDPYYIGVIKEGHSKQKPCIQIKELKQTTVRTNTEMNQFIQTQFNCKKDDKFNLSIGPFAQQKTRLKVIGEQRDVGEYSTFARTKMYQEKINKYYDLIDAERQQTLIKSHLSMHVVAELPFVQLQLETSQLKILDRFLEILQIQMEYIGQGRNVLQELCMIAEKDQPVQNPLVLWINELRDNMSLEVKCRELSLQFNFGSKKNFRTQDYPNQIPRDTFTYEYEDHKIRKEQYIVSMHILGIYSAIKMNMDAVEDKQMRINKLQTNIVLVANDLIIIDPNQYPQHRDSIFLKLNKPSYVTAFDTVQLIQVDSCYLPSYYPSHVLMFSDGIVGREVNIQKNFCDKSSQQSPFLYMEFDFKKNTKTNLMNLQKDIHTIIDLTKLTVTHLNLRIGDGEFRFLKMSNSSLNNKKHEIIDKILLKRKESIQRASCVSQSIGIKKIKISAISLSIPQLYSSVTFANNERVKNRIIRAAVQAGISAQQSQGGKDQEDKKMEYFYGDSWSVFCIDYSKFQMFVKKEQKYSQQPIFSIQDISLDVWDFKVGFLIDSSIYKECAEPDLHLKNEQFPYLLFQQHESTQNNINMTECFEDSYLESLGFVEIANIKQAHFEYQVSGDNERKKQSKIITLNFESINIHKSIDDLEPLVFHIEYLESIVKNMNSNKPSESNQSQQEEKLEQQFLASKINTDSLQKLLDVIIEQNSICTDQDDFVILVGEAERWKKFDHTHQFENCWESEDQNIDLFEFNMIVRSANITLSEGSRFNFKEQKVNFVPRKFSEFQHLSTHPVSNPEFVINQSDQINLQGNFINLGQMLNQNYIPLDENKDKPSSQDEKQKYRRLTLIRERQNIKDQTIKILTISLSNFKSQFNELRTRELTNLSMINSISANLDDITIRLSSSANLQQFIPLLQKLDSNQSFIYVQMNTAETDSSFFCPRLSIQLNQEIGVVLQNSFIDMYFSLEKQLKQINTAFDSKWFDDNKEAVMKIHLITKEINEENSTIEEQTKIIKQVTKKPWKMSCLQIHSFKLVITIKAEQLNFGNLTKFSVLNLQDFNDIEILFLEICLNDLVPTTETLVLIKQLYMNDIKNHQHLILDIVKKVPILKTFVSVSQGIYSLIAYPIIHTLSGEGFVSGVSHGVGGFIGSVADIGSNLSDLILKGARTIVYLAKNK